MNVKDCLDVVEAARRLRVAQRAYMAERDKLGGVNLFYDATLHRLGAEVGRCVTELDQELDALEDSL